MPTLDPQTIVLSTLVVSMILFLTDALRYDAIAILVVLVLAGTGTLDHEEAFANFAHESVILVASMYAFAAAVSRHGITEGLCKRFLNGEPGNEASLAFRLVLITGLMSSVLSNAAVVATMIPVLGRVATTSRIPASRLLMPMAFGSLLGGMLTLIGTSKNIAVNGVIRKLGAEPFELFDFTPFGFALLIVGALYFWGPGRRLLPRSRVEESLTEHYEVPKFLTEVMVEPGSSLVDRTVGGLSEIEESRVTLLGLVRRGGEKMFAPGPYTRIRSDDILILQGEHEAVVNIRSRLGLRAHTEVQAGAVHLVADDVQLVEAVVPPTSSMIGRTLAGMDFRGSTNLNVLAISHHGERTPSLISKSRISVGDTLLIQGHTPDLGRIVRNRDLIVIGSHSTPDLGNKALLTGLLLLAVLLVGALTKVHISVAALGGAVALVLLRCVRPDEIRRSMDLSVLVLIGGMLSLGKAFTEVGLDREVAAWMSSIGGGLEHHPHLAVGFVFVTTLFLTQMLNHITAGVLMAPVAITMAAELGISDRPLLMAVFTGAEFAFMSPVAHQANAMIMGPGDYKYRDFLRCGTPLTILLVITGVFLIPIFWPLTPL